MILNARGALAVKHVLAMSPRQVTWFIDPHALLRHVADLPSLKLALFCQHCYEKGLPEDITALFSPDLRAWTVHCACADYPAIKDRGDGAMVIEKPTADGTTERVLIHSVDELLYRLGWSFKCAGDCARLGMADGVRAGNDPTGHVLKVECGCTDRVYLEPGRN